MKGVCIFLADGFEETEALATLDALRRAGISADTVSIMTDLSVTGAHGVTVMADTMLEYLNDEVEPAGKEDVMIFPGGLPGSQNLADCTELMDMLQKHWAQGGSVAAICAAPGLVISQLPDLEGKKFTCYEGFQNAMLAKGAEYVRKPAVADGNLITGRGPGYAFDFGLAIVSHIASPEVAEAVRRGLMVE